MSLLAAFTIFHVALSLIGIASGFVVLWGLLTSRRLDGWTMIFLVTTVATSVTGFMFPFEKLLPSHKLGIISLVVLAVCIVARYPRHLSGIWRWVYAVTAVLAFYLNFFVLIVQSFQKVPPLHELAPNQNEPPFVAAQLVALVLFTLFTIGAAVRFRPDGAEIGTTS